MTKKQNRITFELKKRGYLVALLIGFNEKDIHLWKVFNHSLRNFKSIPLSRKWEYLDDKQKYNILEDLINLIRPVVRNGLKSILLASPPKTDYSAVFLDHIKKHHRWLVHSKGDNQVIFGELIGSLNTLDDAKILISQDNSLQIIEQVTSDEANILVKQIEKLINSGDPHILLLYHLEEIEKAIYKGGKKDKSVSKRLDNLVITENFLKKNKNRVHRLKQIATNKGISIKIIASDNPAADRINQFGGILAYKKID